jgi:hypothetical protein
VKLSLSEDGAGKCAQFDVYLDGVKQNACTVADSDEGYVLRYRRNVFGAPAMHKSGRPVIERKNGVVVIVRKGTPPPGKQGS